MDNFDKEILIRINDRIQDMLDDISTDLQAYTSYFCVNKYAHKYYSEFEVMVWESMKQHCKDLYQKLAALEEWNVTH